MNNLIDNMRVRISFLDCLTISPRVIHKNVLWQIKGMRDTRTFRNVNVFIMWSTSESITDGSDL